MSAVIGTVAVIFRQTNIVWVMFFCLCVMCDTLVSNVIADKHAMLKSNDHAMLARCICSWLRHAVVKDSKLLLNLISEMLLNIWPYCIVFVAFGVFLWVNGGIVVGARHDHKVTLHFPQLFYYAAFTVSFAAVTVMSLQTLVSFVTFVKRHMLLNIFLLLLCLCAVWRFTYVHRYILADNRHYTFYVWSRLFARHPLMRYVYAPVYIFSGYLLLQALALRRHLFWCIAYVLTVTALLVPAALLEFRYYIVPYIIFRLNIPAVSLRQLVAEITLYVGVNVLTIYVFLHRTFHWNSDISFQRFMW